VSSEVIVVRIRRVVFAENGPQLCNCVLVEILGDNRYITRFAGGVIIIHKHGGSAGLKGDCMSASFTTPMMVASSMYLMVWFSGCFRPDI